MIIITERDCIKAAKFRWFEQYKSYPDHTSTGWDHALTFGQIRRDLLALDMDTCSTEDIDNALHRKGWADCVCSECKKPSKKIIHIGDEDGYEARYVQLCPACLRKASGMMRNGK